MWPGVRFKKSNQQTRVGYLCLLQYFQLHGSSCSTLGRFLLLLKISFFFSWDTSSRTLYVYIALLQIFVRSGFLSVFTLILGDFCEVKFFRGTLLIFSTVIWSYVMPFLNWRQKDEWNNLKGGRALYVIWKAIAIRHNGQKKIMHSTKHWFAINMTSENPQAFSREAFFGGGGEHYDLNYFFSVKQNVKDIIIDGHRRKEQQKESNILKSIKKF